jgi:hypothetical protein
MDPVSALGVAASAVQFVEFASSLVSSTYEIYQSASGGSAANIDLESITSSLKALNADLRHSLSRAASCKELSASDLELNKVCTNCEAVTDRLISALRKLKAQKKHSIWDSFGRALLTVWSKEEVEALQKQLNTFRHQISLQIIASIRYYPISSFKATYAKISLPVNRLVACRQINPVMVNSSLARSKRLKI